MRGAIVIFAEANNVAESAPIAGGDGTNRGGQGNATAARSASASLGGVTVLDRGHSEGRRENAFVD
jgi:hypothetical protein